MPSYFPNDNRRKSKTLGLKKTRVTITGYLHTEQQQCHSANVVQVGHIVY